MFSKKYLTPILCSFFIVLTAIGKPPKLTVAIVLDQFSYQELQTLRRFFSGGIKQMYENGVVYDNAYMPHALPETSVGHASLNTGTLPKDHGIISNRWFDREGNLISSDQDTPRRAAVFSPTGLYLYGRSANKMMVDGLSDQVRLHSTHKKHAAVAVSHKSRAALACAGQLGHAFWLDLHSGFFTSSKAVFPKLPEWVSSFNTRNKMSELSSVAWPFFHKKKSYYAMRHDNYGASGDWGLEEHALPMAGTEIALPKDEKATAEDKGAYELLAKTPAGNKLLINFAKACIHEYIDQQKVDQMLLWVSCSSPDKIGHPYGPYSMEKIDMLYHIDQQIKDLIEYAQRKVGDNNALFVLTSDHGAVPLPETLNQQGYAHARRIYTPELVTGMNNLIAMKYNVSPAIIGMRTANVYLNAPLLNSLNRHTRRAIIHDLKEYLKAQRGIKTVWTQKDLAASTYQLELNELEATYKNQLFPERSGHLICQPYPYVLLTDHHYGTSHASPYGYDTHIPLILYQKGNFKPRKISTHVWAQQLPATLAQLLNIAKPSASTFNPLPGT